MPSIKTNINLSKYLLKALFIRNINVVGALVSPNGTTGFLVNVFITTIPFPKGFLVNVFIFDSDLVISSPQMNF
jgi:hypothetical protein